MVNSVFSIPLAGEKLAISAAEARDGESSARRQFIGGPENQLAQVAARVFANPEPANNPLVFYGPTGRGKSLLARGLVDAFKFEHPQAKTIVTNGADFARAYANAVASDGVADFRTTRRAAALLLVDDVQQLQGKPAAQHELASLIDHFVDHGKRVVATCSDHPARLASLDDGLISRLSGGLAIPLAAPSLASRRALVRHAAANHGVELSDELVELLAGDDANAATETLAAPLRFNSIVLRLRAAADDAERPIDAALVEQILAEIAAPPEPSLGAISTLVARHFQLKVGELRGPSRRQAVVRARGVGIWLARKLTKCSFDQIGSHFGGRDHTTALHAFRKTESLADDEEIREACKELSGRLAAAPAAKPRQNKTP